MLILSYLMLELLVQTGIDGYYKAHGKTVVWLSCGARGAAGAVATGGQCRKNQFFAQYTYLYRGAIAASFRYAR